MMKDLSRSSKWLIAIVISVGGIMGCLIGALWLNFFIYFNPGTGMFILRVIILGGIATCLALSYAYIVKRSENKTRVRQVYAIIGLLVFSAYVFSEYQIHQEERAITAICLQFNAYMASESYEATYGLMSPAYRQTHSVAELKEDIGWLTCYPGMSISILYPVNGKASIVMGGSLRQEIFLKKVNHHWYFTGDSITSQG